MKRFFMSSIAAGMALSLIGAPMAMAQQDQHGPQAPAQHENGPPQHNDSQHGNPQHQTMHHNTNAHPPMQMSHTQSHGGPPPMQHPEQHNASAGRHQWHSGDHYTGGRNYVSNYSHYHLNRPPSGYQWVQDGSEFVLIAVASGIISSVIMNSAYQ